MKRRFFTIMLLFALLGACATGGQTGQGLTLDQAVQAAADNIGNRLESGNKIALLNFSSPSERFSEYVLEELSVCLVNAGKLVVVDRKELDLIRQEEAFQYSGEVSDESAQSIGRKLGAQMVVSGSLSGMGSNYRFRVKTIAVESAAVAALSSADIRAGDQRTVFLLGGAPLPAASVQPAAQTRPAPLPAAPVQPAVQTRPAPAAQTYQIGDTGPAGGIIFYDKGVFESGWRYLEAAPRDFTNVEWADGYYNVRGTQTGIGSGKRNTKLIAAALDRRKESGRAAQLCAAYDAGGVRDWFLPSMEELNLMYTNLKTKGLGGFSNGFYWSSSQHLNGGAWLQNFSDGRQASDSKNKSSTVRSVRAF